MECAMISGPSIQTPVSNQVLEEKINVAIHPEYPEQTVAIGSTLTEKGRKELCSLLKRNLDIFAWKPTDMYGRPRKPLNSAMNNIRGGIFASRKEDEEKKTDKRSISAGLLTGREGRHDTIIFRKPITLRGPEVNYTPMEKLVLALLSASKRLKRYFQAHTVVVITNMPIMQLFFKVEILTKDRNQRPNIGGFYYGATGRRVLGTNTMAEPEQDSGLDLLVAKVIKQDTMADNAYGCKELDIRDAMTDKYTFLSQVISAAKLDLHMVATLSRNQVRSSYGTTLSADSALRGEIISDNGKQFRDNPFKDWCEKLCIRQCFASVKHPQANGLVERANRSLGEGNRQALMKEAGFG
ncbi:reverse transcriptase domain-containing protein [Tanacetum coccineum]|uniref:Reverse transcriptase domain-containing protein n=1 Tax=Tanacetum coccineum TaxID=301880 RepID=A0ABQ5FCI1_9ASTR